MARSRAKSKVATDEEKAKTKARKSGPSFLSKAWQLGVKANVPAFGGYWEPTHGIWKVSVHMPDGWGQFDANKLVGDISITECTRCTNK